MSITLKIANGSELRRLTVNPSANPTFSQVVTQIRKLFPFLDERLPVPLKYADDEGDLVTLATEADWAEAVKFAGEGGKNLIRITLGPQSSAAPSPSPSPSSTSLNSVTPSAPAAKETAPTQPQQDEAMETSDEPQPPASFEYTSMEIPTYPEVPPISSSASSSTSSSFSSAPFSASAFASFLPSFAPPSFPEETSSSSSSNPEKPHHQGVTCDGCNRNIFGIRYKCAECYDFDLCEDCEAKGDHPAHHVTLKIRIPTRVEIWHPYAFRRGPPACGRYGNGGQQEQDQQQPYHHPHHQRKGRCPRWANHQQGSCPAPAETEPEKPQERQQEPTTPENPTEFAHELQLLQEMGFPDRDTNLRLLKEKRGRIEEVISKLTQLSFL